jgi:hypothetical protein
VANVPNEQTIAHVYAWLCNFCQLPDDSGMLVKCVECGLFVFRAKVKREVMCGKCAGTKWNAHRCESQQPQNKLSHQFLGNLWAISIAIKDLYNQLSIAKQQWKSCKKQLLLQKKLEFLHSMQYLHHDAIKDEQYMLNCYNLAYQVEWPHTHHSSLLSVWCRTADCLCPCIQPRNNEE